MFYLVKAFPLAVLEHVRGWHTRSPDVHIPVAYNKVDVKLRVDKRQGIPACLVADGYGGGVYGIVGCPLPVYTVPFATKTTALQTALPVAGVYLPGGRAVQFVKVRLYPVKQIVK